MITAERLREVLHYDPVSGHFTWREKISFKTVVGRLAGSPNTDGYVVIGMFGARYYAHQLAWLYVMGEWPHTGIDHKDLDTGNNAWPNLRLADKSQNARNRPAPKSNTSGRKGVYWHKAAQKWHAQISVGGVNTYLGLFDDLEEAALAYAEAAKRLHLEFARTE